MNKLVLILIVVACVGGGIYLQSKYLSNIFPWTASIAPWIESIVPNISGGLSGVMSWVQGNLSAVCGLVTAGVAGLAGILKVFSTMKNEAVATKNSLTQQISDTKDQAKSQIDTLRAELMVESEQTLAAVKKQSADTIQQLQNDKTSITNNFETYQATTETQISKLSTTIDQKNTLVDSLTRENQHLSQYLEAAGVKIQETVAGTQGGA